MPRKKTTGPGLPPTESIVTTGATRVAKALPPLVIAYNPSLVQAARVVALQAADFTECLVTCEADAEAAAEVLGGVVRAKDQIEAAEALALEGPKAQLKTVKGWFKDALGPLQECEDAIKKQIGDYKIGLLDARDEAAAAELGSNDGAGPSRLETIEALSDATLAAEQKIKGVTFRPTWEVDRVVPDLFSAEFEASIQEALRDVAAKSDAVKAAIKAAAEYGPDERPVVAGVVFKRRAIIGALRETE